MTEKSNTELESEIKLLKLQVARLSLLIESLRNPYFTNRQELNDKLSELSNDIKSLEMDNE